MVIHVTADINENLSTTEIWKCEKKAVGISQDMDVWTIVLVYETHADDKLELDNGDDEIHRAQNEISSDGVEKFAFP